MTLDQLFKFMVKHKILEAKTGDLELKLHPSALVPKMTKKEKEAWEKEIEKIRNEVEKEDLLTWST